MYNRPPVAMLQHTSKRVVILVVSLTTLFTIAYHLYSPERVSQFLPSFSSDSDAFSNHYLQCLPDLEHLQTLKLSSEIRYARADIVVRRDASPSDVTKQQLDIALPTFQSLLPGNEDVFERRREDSLECAPALHMNFPKEEAKPDLSYVTFGLSTTIERLADSFDVFSHWITGTNAVMLAYLEPNSTDNEVAWELQAKAEEMGFTLDLQESDLEHMDRYFALVRIIYERRMPETKWAVIMDDDTFFMSATRLHEFLSSHNASKPYYIGGVTDSFQQSAKFGLIGSGGAGIMLSLATLEELYPEEIYGRCLANNLEDQTERYSSVFSKQSGHYGDIMIANCIHLHTTIKLTNEHSLHQLDMHGDLSGIYEGYTNPAKRQRPLTLHHWKSWHKNNMTNMAAVAPACGDECVLRRWKFANGWWLTNGYSLVRYSDDLPVGDITIERTWNEVEDYRHSFTPLRKPDRAKVSLKLESVVKAYEQGEIRQFYVRRKEAMREHVVSRNLDEVFELVWHFT